MNDDFDPRERRAYQSAAAWIAAGILGLGILLGMCVVVALVVQR